MEKRKTSRGIIFLDDKVVLLKRIRKEKDEYLHYYAIPGGGVEANESLEDTCIREVFEEVSLNVRISKYLGVDEYAGGICYYYLVDYISGIPTLGGEEKERNNKDNYYEVSLIPYSDIDSITIPGMGIEMIKKAYSIK